MRIHRFSGGRLGQHIITRPNQRNSIRFPPRRSIAYDDRELYASLYSREANGNAKSERAEGKENFRKWSTVGDLELSDSAIAALDATEIDQAIHAKFGPIPAGPAILESIRWRYLRDRRLRWGWRIYRTTYKSDEDWTRFLGIFRTCLETNIIACQAHDDHMQFMHWPVVEDKFSLDGASSTTLKEHFVNWRNSDQPWQEAGLTKEVAPDFVHWGAPLYDCFISVDEESLESVLCGGGAPGKTGYVNLVRADWPPSDESEEHIQLEDGYDAIEGMTTQDVGFQHVDLGYVYPDLFEEMRELERRLWYTRPPNIYPVSYST